MFHMQDIFVFTLFVVFIGFDQQIVDIREVSETVERETSLEEKYFFISSSSYNSSSSNFSK